jgi:hypothetical protein
MKKLFVLLLTALLLGSLAGCGGGGGSKVIGAAMTQEQIEERAIASGTATQVAISTYDSAGIGTLSGSLVAVKSNFSVQCHVIPSLSDIINFFKNQLVWTGPDTEGWYSAPYYDGSSNFLFKVRYMTAGQEVQFKVDVTGAQTISAYFTSIKGADGFWDGNGYIIVNGTSGTASVKTGTYTPPTIRVDVRYTDVNETTRTFGTILMIAQVNGVTYAGLNAVYDPDHAPVPETPVYITGWRETSDNPIIPRWVALP